MRIQEKIETPGQTDVINSRDSLQTRKDTSGLLIYLFRGYVTLATERRSYIGLRSCQRSTVYTFITGQRVMYISLSIDDISAPVVHNLSGHEQRCWPP